MGSRLTFSIIVACLLLLWTVRLLVRWRFDWKRCPATATLAALFLLGIWQLTPLPHAVLNLVAPANSQVYARLLPEQREVIGDDGAVTVADVAEGNKTISLEPDSTRDSLFRLLELVLVFVIVRTSVESRRSFRRLCIAVAINGSLLSLYGIIRRYSGGNANLLYQMFFARNEVFGPFLYRNLFALYVNLCIGLGLGLLFALAVGSPGTELEFAL